MYRRSPLVPTFIVSGNLDTGYFLTHFPFLSSYFCVCSELFGGAFFGADHCTRAFDFFLFLAYGCQRHYPCLMVFLFIRIVLC